MRILYLIAAREGSKGIPNKNIKKLNGKPLIHYALDVALELADKKDICVSTDSNKIKKISEEYGLEVPFLRPKELANDYSGMYEVLLHSLNYYRKNNQFYDVLVLLQPTSPLRKSFHVNQAIDLFSFNIDMVVSVKETKSNPYYTLYEEDEEGFIHKSKNGNYDRRQDCPKVWEFNGAIYVMNIKSLENKAPHQFSTIKKYVMNETDSIDIDTELDFKMAEIILNMKHP